MALIRLDHVPRTVKVNLPLNILIPDPDAMGDVPVRHRKVLYLLHGLGDDASAWQRYSCIETLADSYGLVVVMPSVSRSFYADQLNGQRYFSYLTEEIPQYLEDIFGLSPERDNTLIAGLSMGGYGAFKTAFAYPERFSAAASFSGVLSMDVLTSMADDPRSYEFAVSLGDLSDLPGSIHDPAVWLANADPAALPRLYISCGVQDDFYPLSAGFVKACGEAEIGIEYHEEDGRHDWYFWDRAIRWFLEKVLGPLA